MGPTIPRTKAKLTTPRPPVTQMDSYVPPAGGKSQFPSQYPGQYGPGMGGPPSYFDYGNPGPSRQIPPSYDYQPPASEIGKPINLVNSGVVHDLDSSSGRPKQEHGNNKTIMVFGLFGVVVFIVAAIAGAVYSKKKGVTGRRGSHQQRLESQL